jgi:hypothetical protein
MRPNLSEFSYGFALTSELMTGAHLASFGAPLFPSLRQEASRGYDVKLPGFPLFLQFKLVDRLLRPNAKHAALLGLPYFRMHLRSPRHSDQHRNLTLLEAKGSAVFYVCPTFTEMRDLDAAYQANAVFAQSRLWPPSTIPLPSSGEHSVVFAPSGSPAYIASEPIPTSPAFTQDALAELIRSRLVRDDTPPLEDQLQTVALFLSELEPRGPDLGLSVRDLSLAQRVALRAQTTLDATLLIVQPSTSRR